MPDIYWRVTEAAVRRATTLQDRNPASATYGCCDRSFWQYKTVSSFPAATMQQLALPFAVLFDAAFDGNRWHGDREMCEQSRSAMTFWAAAQHRGGSRPSPHLAWPKPVCGFVTTCRLTTPDGSSAPWRAHRPGWPIDSTTT
jgi:hypothetical protein